MLIRIHIILSIWAACSHAVNHAIFKACYNVTVCKDLRKGSETTTFQLPDDLNTFTVSEDTVIGKLSKKGPHKFFKLKIQLLEHNKVRLQLEEDDNKIQRYQLKDILHPDIPKSITPETKVDKDQNTLSITPQDATTGNLSVIIYKSEDSSLLNVTFLYGQHVMVALDGKDIVMDYDDGNEKRDIGFTVLFNEAQKLYGLHHHAYDLELPDTTIQTKDGKYISEPFRLRNSDNAHFEANSPMALYGSVPAIYGHSESSTAGIFLHNAAEQWVDIHYEHNGSPSAHFMVDSGSFDLFVMLGPDTENVVQQFTELTGRAHMPQLWTLGYHQSRWSYYSKEEVLEVVKQMKQNNFPMDAIWLDIDYTDEKKYFTWNENFTGKDNNGVKEMLKALGHDGRKLVTIIDPHIKQDESYEIYTEGREGNFFVKYNGSDFVGECWPGPSTYVDFLNPAARKYYADHYSDKNFHHGHPEVLAGIWNDMNEPSVFDDKNEWSMPSNLWHRSKDGSDVDVEHRDIHNIYGFLHTMSTHQGLIDRDKNGRRPFILTRSHFAGSQRFAAMWTGDNTADWPHLKNSYSECMLSNLMGHVFCGADVPGFFGDPDPEFAYRAYQAAIWLPFFRGHADKNAKPREPYRYDPEVQKIIRTAIKMRYKHIPTWYTLFYEHTLTGAPLIRPVFYHYPGTVNRNEYVMLGRDILATPVFEPGNKTMEVHLPDSETELWYRADDNSFQVFLGGTTIKIEVQATTSPVFYRSGSIIVRQERDVSSTAEFDKLPIALYVNCDKEGAATGRFYHDDGISFNYQKENENKHLYVEFSYNKNDGLAVRKVPGDDDQDHEGLEVFVDKIIYNMRKKPNYASNGDTQDVSYFPYSLEIIGQVLFSLKNEKCVLDTTLALEAMSRHERWALEMFDSFPKFPTGILYGNHYELGNFDECVGARGTIKDEENDIANTIQGQYCLTDIHFRAKNNTGRMLRSVRNKDRYAYNKSVIHWGICLPSSCSSEDAKIFTKEIFAATAEHFEVIDVTIDGNKCYYEKPQPLSKAEIVYGCIVGVFILFIMLATGFHLWYLKQRKHCTAYNVDNLRAKPPSVPKEVIMCFSIIRNVGKFLHTKPNEMNLECICGIKFLSMTIIIAGHSLIFMLGGPVANKGFFRDISTKAENSPFLNNPLLVDTFLLVSGFLLGRLLLMELDKRRGKINFAILYIARYIRLTPAYVVVIGLYATLLPRLGSGPFWESRIGLEQERCLSSWWTNLLYINNYVNTDNLCMFQSWYLAVDYHLFIVAPFLIYALWKWSKIGEATLFTCTLVSIIVPVYVTYTQSLDPTLMAYPPEVADLSTNYYFVTAYIKTHMRCSSYCLGILFGYLVHKIQGNGYKIRPYVMILGWTMSAFLGVMAMYSIVVFYKPEHETSSIEAAIYAPLHRVAWCLAIGWVLVACITDNAALVNKFLSWKIFIPTSRLTYCAYLANGLIEIYNMGVLRQPVYLSKYELTCKILGHVILTYVVAFFLCILFESPIHGLEKILLRKDRMKEIKQNSTVRPVGDS